MPLGFETTGFGGHQVTPDRGLSKNTKPRVLKVQFGDGYEQRIAEGINSLDETYAVSYSNRPKEEVDDIMAFLDNKKGVTAFTYTIPDSNNTPGLETSIKVVCDAYSATYVSDATYSLSATFRRVYEP